MITYRPFWELMTKKDISTYKLITEYKLSRSLIDKLKHDKGLTTSTIDRLCEVFECEVSNIMEYTDTNE